VVTRGGANALCELVALRKLCVCIPLEKGSRGDQVENADYYEKRGAIIKLMQDDLSIDALFSAIATLDKNRRDYLSSMQSLKVDGTLSIVETIRKTMQVLAK
jgi:UDP-N-acetylglucosamine--N-acetylmuramyl-(pentapeptide) pyrophosphoryl-undecaprenol N-acetylglucosamine transferase